MVGTDASTANTSEGALVMPWDIDVMLNRSKTKIVKERCRS